MVVSGINKLYVRNIYHALTCWAWGNNRGEGRQTSGAPKPRGCDA